MKNTVLKPEKQHISATPRRYLSLWFPCLPFERSHSARSHDVPVVLIDKQRGALRVVACDRLAQECGLKLGMMLTEARAILPKLRALYRDSAADHAAVLKLADLCDRFTPLVALDGAEGLLLDVTGCTHLYGGEKAMQAHIADWFSARHLTLKHALAGTPDCAHILARFSAVTHVNSGDEAQAVMRLPIKALECSNETSTALIRAGLKTLGDLASRPSQLLTSRFGPALSTKLRRIFGHEDIRLTPLRSPPELDVEQLFAEPLQNMNILQLALFNLIEKLCMKLETVGKGGRVFEASFFRVDGIIRRLVLETAQAQREPKALGNLFALRLETLADPLEAGFGFDAMRLAVLQSEQQNHSQKNLDGAVENKRGEAELIDRLTIRFGREKVLRFMAQDSHDPLRSAIAVPVATPSTGVPWLHDATALPRPLHLFSPPQPIEAIAEVPDGPPLQFRWRKVLHQTKAAEGPERIESEWWRDGHKQPRDYYRVEDADGSRFWIFREGQFTSMNVRWFMHGLFP
jgi:protein ImuB